MKVIGLKGCDPDGSEVNRKKGVCCELNHWNWVGNMQIGSSVCGVGLNLKNNKFKIDV